MSQDTYQLDRYKHGGEHVDRYNKQGQLVGRYTLTGAPIKHKGVFPPPSCHCPPARRPSEVILSKLLNRPSGAPP